MNKKLNTEQLEQLIPDYITGDISDADKAAVETAMNESPELREFYNEMKETFTFVSSVKQEEPSPQYWGSILHRVHERIESEHEKKFSWGNIAALWKVLVPFAAVVVIALVYYLTRPSDVQLTKDDQKTEQKDNNMPKQDSNEQNKQQPETQEQKITQPDENNIVKEVQPNNSNTNVVRERRGMNSNDNNNVVKDERTPDNTDDVRLPSNENGDVASVELDELSIFTSGTSAGLDEETEDDLKKLDNKELDKLLIELENSNL